MISIPEEILEEILCRVPVKAVLKFRCVSKSWRSLIGSKRFIKSHLENSKKEAVIVYIDNSQKNGVDSLFKKEKLRYITPPPTPYVPYIIIPTPYVPYIIIPTPYVPYIIMGYCNGLVCVLAGGLDIYLCNPSTRTLEKLPRTDQAHRIRNVGFGWEESREEYKVFALVKKDPYQLPQYYLPPLIHACLYSSKTNSWKRLELERKEYDSTDFSAMQFVCGKLHWLHNSQIHNQHIVSFDLKTEMFGMIEYPPADDTQFCMTKLGVVAGCLCFIRHAYGNPDFSVESLYSVAVEVWVMKQYGVRESWVKLMAVDDPLSLSASSIVSPNGEILLFLSSTIVIYSPTRNAFRKLWEFDCCDNIACLHIESLVSPKVSITDDN